MKPLLISTNRLRLRRTCEGDGVSLFRNYCSDIGSSRFLTRQPHTDREQTIRFLNKWCDLAWGEDSLEFAWVVALENTNEAVGVFLVTVEGHKAQIHYGIGRDYEGQGLITEAGHAVIEWLMTQPGLQKIWTVCDLDNYGSIKILEKWGFQNEGILQKAPVASGIWRGGPRLLHVCTSINTNDPHHFLQLSALFLKWVGCCSPRP